MGQKYISFQSGWRMHSAKHSEKHYWRIVKINAGFPRNCQVESCKPRHWCTGDFLHWSVHCLTWRRSEVCSVQGGVNPNSIFISEVPNCQSAYVRGGGGGYFPNSHDGKWGVRMYKNLHKLCVVHKFWTTSPIRCSQHAGWV